MNTCFEILMDIINSALKILNSKGYHIRDPENPEFFIENVYYDPENDELYCSFKEVNMCKKEYSSKFKSKKVHNKDCFWCGSEMIRSNYGWKVCANCGWKHRVGETKFEK